MSFKNTGFQSVQSGGTKRQPTMGLGPSVMITCDRCEEAFDEMERQPTILPDCGHTLCALCINELI